MHYNGKNITGRGAFMISKLVQEIRANWAKSDAERDRGLTTPEDIVRYDDISYGPYGEWNLLDIYYTKDTRATGPAIVSIHGGGWVYGSKEVYQYYCMKLAQRGFTVVNFNYRLAPENPYPAALEDINQVFSYLVQHGEEYFVDTNNLFVVGDSAGAQLASQYLAALTNPEYAKMLGFETPEVTVRAAALNCGIYDIKNLGLQVVELADRIREYMSGDPEKRKGTGSGSWESLNVMKYITGNFPPAFVMSAYHDYLRKHAKPMYEHLTGLGVDCRLEIYGTKEQKHMGHVFHVDCRSKEADQCNDEECAFFRKYIKV